MSIGEKYQFLTSELIKNKEKVSKIKSWDLVYFSRFLYETFPPPRSITSHITSKERQKNNEEKREKQRQYGDFGITKQIKKK